MLTHHRRPTIRAATCLVAALAATALAACGSSDDSEPTSAGGSPSSSLSGDPIGITFINADSGTGAQPDRGDGFEAFIEYANSTDGFAGRPAKLTRCDYVQDPQKASDCAREAVADDGTVLASTAGRQSAVVLPILEKAADPVPNICGSINSAVERSASNAFCLTGGAQMFTYVGQAYQKSVHPEGTKIFCMTSDSDAGHATCGTAQQYAKDLGLTMKTAYFPPETADFLPVAQAVLADKPDMIVFGAGPAQEVSMLKALIQLGSDIPVSTLSELIPAESMPELAAAKFPIVVGAAYPDAGTSDDPEVKLFRKWMEKTGHKDTISGGSLTSWVAGRMAQAAIAKAAEGGEVTRASVLKALRNDEFADVPLLPNPISLKNAPTQTPDFSTLANPTEHVVLIEGGKVNVTDETVTIP